VRGGIWRYQPERRVFETLTAGTTNPWGHDWNSFGELFHVNTVNGHLWHVFAGAHFVRGATVDPNPRVYSLIDMHADHWHFDTGKGWTNSRAGAANALGGGHSHIGAMIYLGDNWPAQFRDHLFTLNQHGRRANQEILERVGSGYVAHRGDDLLFAADPWYVGLDLRYGPDGGVFIIDWNDDGECHGRDGIHRSTGRIYKITYGDPSPADVGDLAKLTPSALVQLHTRPNEWYSRQARSELATRAAAGADLQGAREALRALFAKQTDPAQKLRALWSLYVIGGTDSDFLRAQLHDPDEHIRTWAIRLLSDLWPLDTVVSKRPPRFGERSKPGEDFAHEAATLQPEFARMAREDSSGLVRLALASTLQRIPANLRTEVAAGLVSHAEDAADHNLPLLVWYGLIPVADSDPAALAQLAQTCQWPLTRQYIARRLAEDVEKNPAPLNALLEHVDGVAADDVVAGIQEALAGWRKAPKPTAWDAFAMRLSSNADPARTARLQDLGAVFGDGRALAEVKKIAVDSSAKLEAREAALQTLIDSRPPDLRQLCEKLLDVLHLNTVAARGLATFDDPKIGPQLVSKYRSFHQSERPQLLAALVSRPAFARALLDAVANDKIPRTDVTAFLARQIRNFHDPDLDQKLAAVWGDLHDTAADKQQLMAKLERQLTPDVLAKADKSAGRAVFARTCAVCHRLYGEGADIGPDLTGSGRANLHYLVENIVDPSAVVPVDFRLNIVTLADGRVLNGFITAKTERTITLKTVTEKTTVERSEIKSLEESPLSLMPEGLLQSLSETQVRDLIGYLMYPAQVPLPAGSGQ
jgi:putative heme-binding domain-containing protein